MHFMCEGNDETRHAVQKSREVYAKYPTLHRVVACLVGKKKSFFFFCLFLICAMWEAKKKTTEGAKSGEQPVCDTEDKQTLAKG